MLLEPLEEEFHLPPASVEVSHLEGRETVIVPRG
jgi:hypothetical protein